MFIIILLLLLYLLLLLFSRQIIFLFVEISQWFYHHSNRIRCKILMYKFRDDIFRCYEKRQSQRRWRFDLKLDTIVISLFINLATWNKSFMRICVFRTWKLFTETACCCVRIIRIIIKFVSKFILKNNNEYNIKTMIYW